MNREDKSRLLKNLSIIDEDFINLSLEDYYIQFSEKCELILRRIHFRKDENRNSEFRFLYIQFLKSIYRINQNVRYFNECLWCFEGDKYLEDKELISLFYSNLDSKGYHLHTFNLNSISFQQIESLTKNNTIQTKQYKIGLLGLPLYYGNLLKLKKDLNLISGIAILKHHNKLLEKLMNKTFTISTLKFFYKKFDWHYLKKNSSPSEISNTISREKWDVAFHKLGFILKEDIINSVKGGVINEHWGLLPFVRGKSTIEYSILLNIPVACTHHLVEKKIDCGKIISIYPINIKGLRSTNIVKNKVRKTLLYRIKSTLKNLNLELVQQNDVDMGETFYLVHPFILKHINSKILKYNK